MHHCVQHLGLGRQQDYWTAVPLLFVLLEFHSNLPVSPVRLGLIIKGAFRVGRLRALSDLKDVNS
jgi:hypothetical protein